MPPTERFDRFSRVATALSLRSDRQLEQLLNQASPLGSGIGGSSARLDLDGVPVFAKRIPLTALEQRPEHRLSTANLFQLPVFCQYGVGSPGFGAWRELAANVMASHWVLNGQTEAFPLLYHWRVLDLPPGADSSELADAERLVAFWDGSPAMRERLRAFAEATTSLVLFQEHLPQQLDTWLAAQLAQGGAAFDAACERVEHSLTADVAFMNAQGLMHFDAHFRNILTDGQRLYFADLGLATSARFDLSAEERRFLDLNASHDRCYAVTQWVNWLVRALVRPAGPAERNEVIRAWAAGEQSMPMPAAAAAILRRHAPVAVVMNDFYGALYTERRTVDYPAAAAEAAWSRA